MDRDAVKTAKTEHARLWRRFAMWLEYNSLKKPSTFREIGEKYGISAERVRQIVNEVDRGKA